MTKKAWLLFGAFFTGLIVLLLPDGGKTFIYFNRFHGLSLQDTTGLAILISAWLFGCIIIVKKWKPIKGLVGVRNSYVLIVFYILGILTIWYGLEIEKDLVLWSGIAVAGLINIIFLMFAFSHAKES